MNSALEQVNGSRYTVQQGVRLYPTSGTLRDYAFSRHYADNLKRKIYSFTIEFGKEFVPPFSEMKNIIKEVNAAMTEFCVAVGTRGTIA